MWRDDGIGNWEMVELERGGGGECLILKEIGKDLWGGFLMNNTDHDSC